MRWKDKVSGALVAVAFTAGALAAQATRSLGPDDLSLPEPGAPRPGPEMHSTRPAGPDLTRWQYWWEFHKERFLAEPASGEGNMPSAEALAREAVEPLREVQKSRADPGLSAACLMALAKIARHDPESLASIVPLLTEALRSEDQTVRENAALALGIAGDPESERTLRDLLVSIPPEVAPRTRVFACFGLALLARNIADPALTLRTHDRLADLLAKEGHVDFDLQVAAVQALRILPRDQATTPVVIATLLAVHSLQGTRRFDVVRAHALPGAASLLGRGSSELHEEVKRRCLLDLEVPKRDGIPASAAIALGIVCGQGPVDEKCVTALSHTAMTHRDSMTRRLATMALGEIGGEYCEKLLVEWLGSVPRRMKDCPALALGLLGRKEPRFASDIASALQEERAALQEWFVGGQDQLSKQVRTDTSGALTLALALLGQGDLAPTRAAPSVRTLVERLRDDRAKPEDRAAAAAELGCLAESEPWSLPLLRDLNYRACPAVIVAPGSGVLTRR